MTERASKLVVIGDIPHSQYKSTLQKLRLNGAVEVVKLPTEFFPVWEEGYELFFLMMGHSAMDDVAIARKYGCSPELAYTALWDETARVHGLKIGQIAGVVFPFDLGWVPDDMAELFMSHLPKSTALEQVFPVRRGKIMQPGSSEYDGVYRIFADSPETTLEI